MEPLTLAASFATIVGLMADFASSRKQGDPLELTEFVEWLRFHGHTELLSAIEKNAATTTSIKASLAEGRQELLSRLSSIEGLLGSLMVGQGPLEQLALSVHPDAVLSPQAIAVLQAYEDCQAGKALLHFTFDGPHFTFLDGSSSSSYQPQEPRFLEDDLAHLVDLSLLTLSHNKRGEKVLHLTRRGSAVARSMTRSTEAVGT